MNELQKKLARRRALNGEGTNDEAPKAEPVAPVRQSSRRFSQEELAPFQGGDKVPAPSTPSYLRSTNASSSSNPFSQSAAPMAVPTAVVSTPLETTLVSNVAPIGDVVDEPPIIAAEPSTATSIMSETPVSSVEQVAATHSGEDKVVPVESIAQTINCCQPTSEITKNVPVKVPTATASVAVADVVISDKQTVAAKVMKSNKKVPPPPPLETDAKSSAQKNKNTDTTLGDLEELQEFLGDMNDSYLSSLDNTAEDVSGELTPSGTSSSQRYNMKKAQMAAGEDSAEFDIMQAGSVVKQQDGLFSLDNDDEDESSRVIRKVVKNKLNQRLSIMGFDPSAISMVDMFNDGDGVVDDSTSTTTGTDLLPSVGKLFSFDVSATSLLQGNKALLKKEEGQEELSRQKAADDRRMRLDHHGLFSSDNLVDKGEVDIDGAKPSSALFQEDVSSVAKKKTVVKVETLSYDDFMNKLTQFESKPVMDAIRRFFASILGPRGDGSPPPVNTASKLSYTFHGIDQLDKRCSDFFEAMIEHFQSDPLWKHLAEDEDQRIVLRNHLEMYIMNPIAEMAFKSVTNKAEDDALYRKMRSLSFLKPEALDINPALQNDIVFSLAGDALRKMNNHRIPHDKAECVVNCASILFRSLSLASAKTNDDSECVAFGADDFLPIFIYVVLRSNVPKLVSNCEYIQAFYNPAQLMSKAGYFFVNLRSAMEFILNMDVSSINMDPDEFNRKLAEAEDDYN